MVAELTTETRAELMRYVSGDLSNAELDDWLVGIEYDPELPQDERDALARIRLVLIEVREGLRNVSEVLEVVVGLLASYGREGPVIALRSGSSTTWQEESGFTATPAPLQRVGI